MDTEVTTRAIQRLKIGKHDLKLEADVLQTRAIVELEYSRRLRDWARTLRSHVQDNDLQDLKEIRKTFVLLADEADAESNKHHKVYNDVWMNINGPYKRILRFREMNYHKEDNGRGCREIKFYEDEFEKLQASYKQVNDKFEKWKLRLSEVKKSTNGSRPWFLRPSHKSQERQIRHVEKKYNLHSHREREERRALLQNTTRLLDEMRGQENKRVTMLIDEFKAYLRILKQNHDESFTRRECLNNVESHINTMKLDEVLENWSEENRKADFDARQVRDRGDGIVRTLPKRKGFNDDALVEVTGISRHKLVDDKSERSTSEESCTADSCSQQSKDGVPPEESREDTMLHLEKGELQKDMEVEMFQMSDADDLEELELDTEVCFKKGRRILSKLSEGLFTQSSAIGLQKKGYAVEMEEPEEITLEPEKREEARTTAWVLRQTAESAWNQPIPEAKVRQTKSSKDHRESRRHTGPMKNSAVFCSAEEVRQPTKYRVSVALDTLGVGTTTVAEQGVPLMPAKQEKQASKSSSFITPRNVTSLEDYRAKAPNELSFNKGRALTMIVGENEDGMAYGYKTTNTGKKKMGFFPSTLVQTPTMSN